MAIRRSEAMPRLIESLPALPFEARKDVSQVSCGGGGDGDGGGVGVGAVVVLVPMAVEE